MVTAIRLGRPYCVEVGNGRSLLLSDTQKDGKGGDAGMRPHELLEGALAACISMSIDMAAERAAVTLPAGTVEVIIERLAHETGFDVSLHFTGALSGAQQDLVRGAVQASPVARTLGKSVRVRPAVITTA